MEDIINFLREKKIDFELNQDSESSIVRFKIGGYSIEILIAEKDTVDSFKASVNAIYKNKLERDYKFFSEMATGINRKRSEYKGIF